MLGQVGTVGERLVACGALVGLRLPHVQLGVQLQVSFTCKQLKNIVIYYLLASRSFLFKEAERD